MYRKNSKLSFGKVNKSKVKKLTLAQTKQLKEHMLTHEEAQNDPEALDKHMTIMMDLIKQGHSFSVSHTEAQNKYPMKMITFELLWDLILHLTDWRTVEQDDVPPILKAVRTRHAEAIPLFKPRDRRDIFQDDNFF